MKDKHDEILNDTNLKNAVVISSEVADGLIGLNNTVFNIISKIYTPETQKALTGMTKLLEKFYESFSPCVRFIQSYDFTPIINALQQWQQFSSTYENIEHAFSICMEELYENKWFPSLIHNCRPAFMLELYDIMKATRTHTKKREKLIDRLVFQYYDKQMIKDIKSDFKRNTEIETCHKRIILEALYAFEKKKYATTQIILTSLWQGVIIEKTEHQAFYRDAKVKEMLSQLINKNDESELYSRFFEEYIYYNCNGKNEVKEDVPGRHGVAHGWFKKYPSKKAALNAVLFTQYLYNLRPLNLNQQTA